MSVPVLTPAALDQAAAARMTTGPALAPVEVEAWRGILNGYQRTAPTSPAARTLVTKTVDELIAEALHAVPEHGRRPQVEVLLPGRLARTLPGWAHRTYGDLSMPPSVQLYVAARVLEEWGWQNTPHHLRDLRGRRCLCGAICTTVSLGIGSTLAAEQAAWHVLCELRDRGWPHLIGDWNQAPGRTAAQAIDLLHAARQRAINAGQ